MKKFDPKTTKLSKNIYIVSGTRAKWAQFHIDIIEPRVFQTLAAAQEAMKQLVLEEQGEGEEAKVTIEDFSASAACGDSFLLLEVNEESVEFNR